MQRFNLTIKMHALDERNSGKSWKQVQDSIKQRFNLAPPTIRAMEKWEKEMGREKISQLLLDETKKGLPDAEASSLKEMAQGLVPVLWKARDAGANVELEGWMWFLSLIERQLGRSRFDEFLEEYKKRRAARVDIEQTKIQGNETAAPH